MFARFAVVYHLGVKEIASLRADPMLLLLIAYAFTFAVYGAANDPGSEISGASVAVVDADRSPLSRRIVDGIFPPRFRLPVDMDMASAERALESGQSTFVLDFPDGFQADVLRGRAPALQLRVDATAIGQAARGAGYLTQIAEEEIAGAIGANPGDPPVRFAVHAKFNPNLDSKRFQAIMEVANNVTILAIVLTGAAVVREREHGTLQHLLAMPVRPIEIVLAKVWANGAVVLGAALLALVVLVRGVLGVPFAGSLGVFAIGTLVYLFAVTAVGVLLATLARTMPQFGLLSIPVFTVMFMLSGSYAPLEGMPRGLELSLQLSPTTHFVRFAQGVLFRGAGFADAWADLAGIALTGAAFLAMSLHRFRSSAAVAAA